MSLVQIESKMTDRLSDTGDQPKVVSRYRVTRECTERLCEPLEPDDYQLQSMPNCSPPKWHLAHSTCFFETFVLASPDPNFRPHEPQYNYLFNSYYEAVGDRWPRPARGLLSRPSGPEVYAYRHAVDERIEALLQSATGETIAKIAPIIEL